MSDASDRGTSRPAPSVAPWSSGARDAGAEISLSRAGVWSRHSGSGAVTLSPPLWDLLGFPRGERPPSLRTFIRRVHAADRSILSGIRRTVSGGKSATGRFRYTPPDGPQRWLAFTCEIMRSDAGEPLGAQGILADAAPEESRAASDQDLLTASADLVGAGFATVDADGRVFYANQTFAQILGLRKQEVVGRRLPAVLWPDTSSTAVAAPADGELVPFLGRLDVVFRRPDGTNCDIAMRSAVLMQAGRFSGRVVTLTDVTAHKEVERRLELTKARFRSAFEFAGTGTVISDLGGNVIDINEKMLQIVEASREELIGSAWTTMTLPEDHALVHGKVEEMLAGRYQSYRREARLRTRKGRVISTEIYCTLVRDSAGEPAHFVTQVVDVTDRVETAAKLREAAIRFRQVTETIDDVFWIASRGMDEVLYISPGFEKIWGRPAADVMRAGDAFVETIHPDDRASMIESLPRSQKEGKQFSHTYRIVRPGGEVRWVHDRGYPVIDEDGEIRTLVGVARDVTESLSMQERMAQAQRLESVGQLTGELAHDFNNLLSIVVLNAKDLLRHTTSEPRLRRQLETIVATATRGGQVTKALLAVARRQHLQPALCDLDAVIEASRGLIETSAGPQVDVELVPSGCALAEVDAAAFTNALLNLVINARHAMSESGHLTIATKSSRFDATDQRLVEHDLPAGEYVSVEVSDTGTGMTPEIQRRALEPFFSTKEPGLGSGLGLAAVYGFARQSRGTLVIDSVVGKGTRVTILVPQADGSALPAVVPSSLVRKGWGRILLVDDEPDLLEIMAETLAQAGYSVTEAESGDEALKLLDGHSFDLMLSDVAMRRMSGLELARRASRLRPKMKILLMSGFAAAAQTGEAPLWRILEKPITPEVVTAAIAETLGANRSEKART